MARVLRLDMSGVPTAWLSREDAVMLYAKNLVRWELGAKEIVILGGTNRQGNQSRLEMSPVIATHGEMGHRRRLRKSFNNRMLFRRDKHMCMYCGHQYTIQNLTRDHVQPSSRGGKDIWENVVAACHRCNHFKADRTPEEAGMELLAVPFRPNVFESMFLAQHIILDDQMAYLEKQFSGKRNWKAA